MPGTFACQMEEEENVHSEIQKILALSIILANCAVVARCKLLEFALFNQKLVCGKLQLIQTH